MTEDDAEIDTLTAKEISPIAGLDVQSFKNFVTRALAGDTDVPPSIFTLVRTALHEPASTAEKREQQWWQDFICRQAIEHSLTDIDGLIVSYNAMADWHHEQAQSARERIRQAADKLAELDEFSSGANEVLSEKERSGEFDRAKAIKLLESRGLKVPPNTDSATLTNMLLEETRKANQEKRDWTGRYDETEREATLHEQLERENRAKARELIEKRDAITSGGFDVEDEAGRLRNLVNEYKTDVQLKAAEMDYARNDSAAGKALDVLAQQSFDSSQKTNEEAEFLASVASMTTAFEKAATTTPVSETANDAPAKRKTVTLPAPS